MCSSDLYSERLSFLRLAPREEVAEDNLPSHSASGGSSETESWLDPTYNEPGEDFPAEIFTGNVASSGTVIIDEEMLDPFS